MQPLRFSLKSRKLSRPLRRRGMEPTEERLPSKEKALENFEYFTSVRKERAGFFTKWPKDEFGAGLEASNRRMFRHGGLLLPPHAVKTGYFTYDPTRRGEAAGCNVYAGITFGELLVANCPKSRGKMDPKSASRPTKRSIRSAHSGRASGGRNRPDSTRAWGDCIGSRGLHVARIDFGKFQLERLGIAVEQDATSIAPRPAAEEATSGSTEGLGVGARKAIWIASYPKSGNTWVRVFIHNLLRQLRGETEPQDINALGELTRWEQQAHRFAERLGRPVEEASALEIAAARPLIQADILRACNGPAFFKTHNAVAAIGGHPTVNFEITQAAIYVLRNPLDVAISYAHHAGRSPDEIIGLMAHPQSGGAGNAHAVYEFLGSWSFHVASWMSVLHRPVLLLRYEDMRAAPERAFGRLAAFLRLKPSAEQLRRAIEDSSFAELGAAGGSAGICGAARKGGKIFPQGRGRAVARCADARANRGGRFRPCADDAAVWLFAGKLRRGVVKGGATAAPLDGRQRRSWGCFI